jgi:hypothetical protein
LSANIWWRWAVMVGASSGVARRRVGIRQSVEDRR